MLHLQGKTSLKYFEHNPRYHKYYIISLKCSSVSSFLQFLKKQGHSHCKEEELGGAYKDLII